MVPSRVSRIPIAIVYQVPRFLAGPAIATAISCIATTSRTFLWVTVVQAWLSMPGFAFVPRSMRCFCLTRALLAAALMIRSAGWLRLARILFWTLGTASFHAFINLVYSRCSSLAFASSGIQEANREWVHLMDYRLLLLEQVAGLALVARRQCFSKAVNYEYYLNHSSKPSLKEGTGLNHGTFTLLASPELQVALQTHSGHLGTDSSASASPSLILLGISPQHLASPCSAVLDLDTVRRKAARPPRGVAA